jgi:hypothetical protein
MGGRTRHAPRSRGVADNDVVANAITLHRLSCVDVGGLYDRLRLGASLLTVMLKMPKTLPVEAGAVIACTVAVTVGCPVKWAGIRISAART